MGKGVVTLDRSKVKRGIAAYAAMWLWVGWIAFYFVLIITLPLLIVYAKIPLTVIFGLIVISAVYPIKVSQQPSWGLALGRWAMEGAADYFHIKIVVEDPSAIEKAGVCIFALEPHDVLPLSIFAFNDCFGAIKGTT